MKSFSPFLYLERQYDLSHLNAFYTEFIQPANKEKEEKMYRCLIEFSHHCFTKSPNVYKGETLNDYPDEIRYITDKETPLFCWDLHELSKQLPQIVRQMDQQKCFFTSANDKFLTVSLQTKSGKTVDYEIYFSMKKSKLCDVHIFINSAYLRSLDYQPKQQSPRRKTISFFVLLHNTMHNKRIKRPL